MGDVLVRCARHEVVAAGFGKTPAIGRPMRYICGDACDAFELETAHVRNLRIIPPSPAVKSGLFAWGVSLDWTGPQRLDSGLGDGDILVDRPRATPTTPMMAPSNTTGSRPPNKILIVRQGSDHQEATEDDHVFQKTFDIASEMKSFIDVQSFEIDQIDRLNKEAKLKTFSFFYRIESHASLRGEKHMYYSMAVYNQADKWVEYWVEK